VRKNDGSVLNLTAEQRLLLLDTWRRSGHLLLQHLMCGRAIHLFLIICL
jgi:hypothetical protein